MATGNETFDPIEFEQAIGDAQPPPSEEDKIRQDLEALGLTDIEFNSDGNVLFDIPGVTGYNSPKYMVLLWLQEGFFPGWINTERTKKGLGPLEPPKPPSSPNLDEVMEEIREATEVPPLPPNKLSPEEANNLLEDIAPTLDPLAELRAELEERLSGFSRTIGALKVDVAEACRIADSAREAAESAELRANSAEQTARQAHSDLNQKISEVQNALKGEVETALDGAKAELGREVEEQADRLLGVLPRRVDRLNRLFLGLGLAVLAVAVTLWATRPKQPSVTQVAQYLQRTGALDDAVETVVKAELNSQGLPEGLADQLRKEWKADIAKVATPATAVPPTAPKEGEKPVTRKPVRSTLDW